MAIVLRRHPARVSRNEDRWIIPKTALPARNHRVSQHTMRQGIAKH